MVNKQNTYRDVDYWIACSGGVDSVFLVHLFLQLNKSIGILHCNFKLREEESDKDESFVRALANELNIPIQVKVFDVNVYKKSNKSNTQLAARELRYQWFEEVKGEATSKVVLGHHLDDQRETFLLQLARGASVNGLAAMPYERNGFIRPLLGYTKKEIQTICELNQWEWREDASNQKDDYSRNNLRLNLLPLLVENGLSLELIDELIKGYQSLLHFIHKTKLKIGSDNYRIDLKAWRDLPKLYRNELLHDIGFGKNNINLVEQVASAEKGAYANRNGIDLWNEGDFLLFKTTTDQPLIPELVVASVSWDEVDYDTLELYIDAEKVKGTISLRYWENGDEFSPLGLKGKKKVSDFLKDKKVSSSQKRSHLVVCDDDGIIGLIGFLPSNRVRISKSTKQILRLSVEKS